MYFTKEIHRVKRLTPDGEQIRWSRCSEYPLSNISYFGETYKEMWGEPVKSKKSSFLDYLNHLDPWKPNLVVIHTATPGPEMDALYDMNAPEMNSPEEKPLSSLHRQTELNMLLSPEFMDLIGKKFTLINYKQLLATKDINILIPVKFEMNLQQPQ